MSDFNGLSMGITNKNVKNLKFNKIIATFEVLFEHFVVVFCKIIKII